MSRSDTRTALTPTEVEVVSAKATLNLIRHHSNADVSIDFHAKVGDTHDFYIQKAAVPLFLAILEEIANGNAVQVIAEERELTTQEAAKLLNVSRPHLVRLLDEGRIPFHWVGTHRRVMYKDVKTYWAGRWSRRKATLDRLAALDQELGLNE